MMTTYCSLKHNLNSSTILDRYVGLVTYIHTMKYIHKYSNIIHAYVHLQSWHCTTYVKYAKRKRVHYSHSNWIILFDTTRHVYYRVTAAQWGFGFTFFQNACFRALKNEFVEFRWKNQLVPGNAFRFSSKIFKRQ